MYSEKRSRWKIIKECAVQRITNDVLEQYDDGMRLQHRDSGPLRDYIEKSYMMCAMVRGAIEDCSTMEELRIGSEHVTICVTSGNVIHKHIENTALHELNYLMSVKVTVHPRKEGVA